MKNNFILCLLLSIIYFMGGYSWIRVGFVSSFLGREVYAQGEEGERDPFEPIITKGEELPPPPPPPPPPHVLEEVTPPAVNIEGVLWGTDKPLTIIDGEVYSLGDTLKNADAKVEKIEKNKVFILYQGQVFEMGIKSKL